MSTVQNPSTYWARSPWPLGAPNTNHVNQPSVARWKPSTVRPRSPTALSPNQSTGRSPSAAAATMSGEGASRSRWFGGHEAEQQKRADERRQNADESQRQEAGAGHDGQECCEVVEER